MAYQPPYGAPPGQGQYQYGAPPPQQQYGQPQQYGAPPPQQYGAPPPQQQYGAPPQQQYGAPPQQPPYGQPGYQQPQQPQYGAPPGQYGAPPGPPPGQYAPPQQPPYGQQGQYPPQQPPYGQQQQYGAPPPQQYGAPPPQQGAYGAPPQQQYPQQGYGVSQQQYTQPTPPSLGYGPAQHIPYDGIADADALRKAMKGIGTNEKALIAVLADKDPLQTAVLQRVYQERHTKNLINEVKSEVSGYFEDGLTAIIRGPLAQDVMLLLQATDGPGTKELVLNDVLLGRSNADMRAIKEAYTRTYRRSLEADIKADLSMKTERHFLMVLGATRNEESSPVIPQQIDQDVLEIYKATEGKMGTDELLVCQILTQRSNAQIAAIAHTYKQKYQRDLEVVIKKEFSGHMESALLYQLRTGVDKAMRDAVLLEETMSGIGTKDNLLVNRVIRAHWDRNHMNQVKGAYKARYRTDLARRIKGETSGDYERLMIACIYER
ncbi:related to annexin XIV [Rhynchosporium secalis]|uniref:Annexin n=1 Tax=Rhynchosporium secalis TaxID=38038 RepID=A0A1E1LYH7_RHYSE|nr:related to annexin XIV [Rhynchosporium secalis]